MKPAQTDRQTDTRTLRNYNIDNDYKVLILIYCHNIQMIVLLLKKAELSNEYVDNKQNCIYTKSANSVINPDLLGIYYVI